MQLQTIKVVLAEGGVGTDLSSALKSVVVACKCAHVSVTQDGHGHFGSSVCIVEIQCVYIL